ncbi:MAG: YiiX/YebB-like N1pC/P60 family cysteine hydrolase [Bacteroidales bacterium]|nr:YiiX/YebB-like N1pC/P60 family cysteine hydrolase [Bacteroidales bacterium]
MRFNIYLLTIELIFSAYLSAQKLKIKQGDLLFQYIDCGALCDAINRVTPSFQGRHFNHVGIVVKTDSGYKILEAVSKGVCLTPLEDFIERSGKENILRGRVPRKYRHHVSNFLHYLKKPYDTIFLLNNEAYYCSELAYELFRDRKGKHFFHIYPMTFKDPLTQTTDSVWIQYFKKMNVAIPEGEPGLSPGSMLNEKKIKIKKSLFF